MGCNRKVKLLVSELFRGREVQKYHFSAVPAGPSFTKSSIAAQTVHLSKKESCLILAG